MTPSFHRVARWLAQKLAVGLLIVVLVLAAGGGWLSLQDRVNVIAGQQELLTKLNRDQQHMSAELDEVSRHMTEMQAELAKQQAREQMLSKAIAGLHKLRSWWAGWFGDREKQRTYAAQLARDIQLQHETAAREVALQREIVHVQWAKDGLEIELGWLNKRLSAAGTNRSRVAHYLMLAWDKMKGYAAIALGLYFFGPALGKLVLFFGLARLIESGRPIRLAGEPVALPQVGESGPSLDTSLWPGERLWVKPSFLQTADESLRRRRRLVLDWRVPFTCLACGLVRLVELRHARAGQELSVMFAHGENPATELALVSVPDGGSLVLRPSFLKAIILGGEARLKIRQHWRFLSWQSWITRQFRFFEFAGPCRLLVAGGRGLHAERLGEREGQARPVRRTNQDATIGFTPNLDYRLVRAGRFWAYFRRKNPLFDNFFAGPGLVLCQRAPAKTPRKFWPAGWGGVLKIFGA